MQEGGRKGWIGKKRRSRAAAVKMHPTAAVPAAAETAAATRRSQRPSAPARLFCTSSLPRQRFMKASTPALTPVMTAKLRACTTGPPIFSICGGGAAPPAGGQRRRAGPGHVSSTND